MNVIIACMIVAGTLICPGVAQAQGIGLIAPGHVIGNGTSTNPGEATDADIQAVINVRAPLTITSAPVTIGPASGLTSGLIVTQNVLGTQAPVLQLNQINIADSANLGASANGLNINYIYGGGASQGSRQAIQAGVTLSNPTNAANANHFYVGGAFNSQANSGDNGTGTTLTTNNTTAAGNSTLHFAAVSGVTNGAYVTDVTNPGALLVGTTVSSQTGTTVVLSTPAQASGVGNGDVIAFANTSKGSMIGASSACTLLATATFLNECSGLQITLQTIAGSVVLGRTGLTISDVTGSGGVQGSQFDEMISLGNSTNSPGFWYGIAFDLTNYGAAPIASYGTMIGSLGAQTVKFGLDFNSLTISSGGLFIRGPSGVFGVSGSGNVTGLNFTAGASAIFNWTGRSAMQSPSDGTIILSNNAQNSFTQLDFGGTTAGFPAWTVAGTGFRARLADLSADTSIQGSIINASTGFQITGAAPSAHYPRGNGTNYVDSAIQAADIQGLTLTWTAPHTWNIASTIASATGAALDDLNVQAATTTITGNTGSPITRLSKVSLYRPTFTDSSAVTVTDASTLYIDGPPIAAGSVTFTNGPWTMQINGHAQWLTGNVYEKVGSFLVQSTGQGYYLQNAAGTSFAALATSTGHYTLLNAPSNVTFFQARDADNSSNDANWGYLDNDILSITNRANSTTFVQIGNIASIASATSATWDMVNVKGNTLTVTGSTNITTAAGFNQATIYQPTITDASAVTITNSASLTVVGAPVAAGSVTITNAYAFWVQAGQSLLAGKVFLSGLTAGSGTKALCLNATANEVQTDTSATICGISALRFKNLEASITPEQGLAGIVSLRTETWRYKPEYQDRGAAVHVGLIADDLEAMDARCRVNDNDGSLLNYSDRCWEAYATAAIKKLKADNDNLRAELLDLKRAGR